MGVLEILTGLKDKVLDAATYEMLKRNFELLESNYKLTIDQNTYLKEENERLNKKINDLYGTLGEMGAEIDMLKGKSSPL